MYTYIASKKTICMQDASIMCHMHAYSPCLCRSINSSYSYIDLFLNCSLLQIAHTIAIATAHAKTI